MRQICRENFPTARGAVRPNAAPKIGTRTIAWWQRTFGATLGEWNRELECAAFGLGYSLVVKLLAQTTASEVPGAAVVEQMKNRSLWSNCRRESDAAVNPVAFLTQTFSLLLRSQRTNILDAISGLMGAPPSITSSMASRIF